MVTPIFELCLRGMEFSQVIVDIADIIADANLFGEQNMYNCHPVKGIQCISGMLEKKTPPGGERSRGGANKGTGIHRVETVVPRQLVSDYSK